ncbi:DnaJ-like cysteine-rich domain-containing protein [Pyxidicoccus xibeiensis]|uniref:hypothetical protein n=1 Tax=Pyxidicoccus xibeiensis TaxID=2906759 RepID=UPI0020A78AB4|nr:hypothetical protein [Pyxidicoccus xibeiensis]MCP3143380.1 hypothetical protein [Pyxidicoccus xibeiensis]
MVKPVTQFMTRYLVQEYDTEVMKYAARHHGDFTDELSALSELCGPGVAPPLERPVIPDRAWREENEPKADLVAARTAFRYENHAHPRLGELHAFYLSDIDPDLPERRLRQLIYVADEGKGFLVIARYALCERCRGTGQTGGSTCPECAGSGWRREAGEDLSAPGRLVEATNFEVPPHPDDLPAWEALQRRVP